MVAARGTAGRQRIVWPEGRRFAFSIFDDTDWTTLRNGPPVYDLLGDLGFRITKSVWIDDPGPHPTTGGSTCADPEYLDWVLSLQGQGHEIAFHNATDRSSARAETAAALDRFEQLFGHPPRCGADHAANAEALYAGPARVSGALAAAYSTAQRILQPERPRFSGQDETSRYFWGDLCRDRICYWRRFSFARTDLSAAGPLLHHDPLRPYVNAWFNSSHGPRREQFLERLSPSEIEGLAARGGVCLMYTHLGLDFVDDLGRPHRDVVSALTRVAELGGWLAPVSDILDHVVRSQGIDVLDARSRARMEWSWVADRVRHRAPIGPSVATHDRSLEPA